MKRFSNFKIGLFILSGIGIAVGILLWISALNLFRSTRHYVTFFDSSIQGIAPGSEVKYLGVNVGQVAGISLIPDRRLVRVLMQFPGDFTVRDWMAARLQFGGITGGKYLGLVEAPQNLKAVTPKIDFRTDYPVIPSVPGQLDKALNAMENIYADLQDLDIGNLVNQWEALAREANAVLEGGELEAAVKNIRTTTARLEKLSGAIADAESVDRWNDVLADVSAAAESARAAAATLQRQLGNIPSGQAADISEQVDETFGTIEESTRSVEERIGQTMTLLEQNMRQLNQTLSEFQNLAQTLRRQPGRVLTEPEQEEPFSR